MKRKNNTNSPVFMQDDASLNSYKRYLGSQTAPLPLTAAEEELRHIKLNELWMIPSVSISPVPACSSYGNQW
ncbi:hypothetical protein AMELA_G00298180 [Ameiurus melas]|uniref:Uncharacterized protein n=1 Tax=Ameiurus melas TaxID=219545 RepID=A0A7J5ZLQ6_AMEME|nr:hypothetical protein AMELA_G00298180 [Ameiurus melas]